MNNKEQNTKNRCDMKKVKSGSKNSDQYFTINTFMLNIFSEH